jgi:hypothetical protein
MQTKLVILLAVLSIFTAKAAENNDLQSPSLPEPSTGGTQVPIPRPTLLQLKNPPGENATSFKYEYEHYDKLSPDLLTKMIAKGYDALAAIQNNTIDFFAHTLDFFAGDLSKYNNRWLSNGIHFGFGTEYLFKSVYYSAQHTQLIEEHNQKRKAQLETFICVIWALTDYAFKNNEGFKRGSFSIIDRDLKLYNYLEKFSKFSADFPQSPVAKPTTITNETSPHNSLASGDTPLRLSSASSQDESDSKTHEDQPHEPTLHEGPQAGEEDLSLTSENESRAGVKIDLSSSEDEESGADDSQDSPSSPPHENEITAEEIHQHLQASPSVLKPDSMGIQTDDTSQASPSSPSLTGRENLQFSSDSEDEKKIEPHPTNLSPAILNIWGSTFAYLRNGTSSHYVGLSTIQIGIDARFTSEGFTLPILPFNMTHVLWGAVRTQLGNNKIFVKFEEYGLGDTRSTICHSLNFSASTKGIDEHSDVRREKAILPPIALAAQNLLVRLFEEQIDLGKHQWILDVTKTYMLKKKEGFFQDSSKIDIACLYKLSEKILNSQLKIASDIIGLAQELQTQILKFYDKKTIKFRTGNEVVYFFDAIKKSSHQS